ncbi:hypothetical protein BLNAU_6701 [Blattamonas nauphoetae]|uniref:Transmembrane protein n=1 Tax=Blattamonas nauphoetae TaxID=2049346 RepID=A0ABQ9Y3W8_9EUKA|nr:hypothetical protein BLNAU_6701 [Blattamonas nauphoetae]
MTESSIPHITPIQIAPPITIHKPLAIHPFNHHQKQEVIIPPIVQIPLDFELQSVHTMTSSRSLYSMKSHLSSVGAREMQTGVAPTLRNRISWFVCFMLVFLSVVSILFITAGFILLSNHMMIGVILIITGTLCSLPVIFQSISILYKSC